MQQFLLFCTMLIITSRAFSQELHGRRFSNYFRRKTSRFAPRLMHSHPDMLGGLNNFFLEPFGREIPKYGVSFFVAHRPRGFKSKREKNYALQKNRRFSSRKRLRRKLWKERKRALPFPLHVPDSFIFSNPQCFQSDENFVNFENFGDPQRDLMIRSPNQYIVCFYPVFNRFKKLTFSRFPSLRRQYFNNFESKRIKSKRSATDLSAKNETGNQQEQQVNGSENHLASTDIHKPCYTTEKSAGSKSNFDIVKPVLNTHIDETSERSAEIKNLVGNSDTFKPSSNQPMYDAVKNTENKNFKENFDVHDSIPGLPFDFGFNSDEHKKNPVRNPSLPTASDSLTDYYGPSLDVTLPPVTIPKLTFKYPYDPQLYESSLRKGSIIPAKPFKKETTSIAEEDVALESFPRDLGKLKLMLEEVESVLKSKVTGKCNEENKKKKEKKDKKKKDKEKKKEKECSEQGDKKNKPAKQEAIEKLNETITLKEKIDTIAIPVLAQISRELGRVANESSLASGPTSSSSSPSSPTSPPSPPSPPSISESYDSKSDSKKVNVRCGTDGTWTSTGLGFDITITTLPNMMLKVKISAKSDSLINTKWSIHGLTLSKHGGPLMLAAIYPQRRKIASFIGQCKICKDQDLIFGAWTIYTCAKKYSDLWKSVETKLDILKRIKA